MKKIAFILSLLVFSGGFTSAQASQQILDQMVKKYESTSPCLNYKDGGVSSEPVQSLIDWTLYKNCRENDPYFYDNVMSYAVPNFVLSQKDLSIFLLNCTQNWHQYECPKDLTGVSKPLYLPIKNYSVHLMTKYFNSYVNNIKSIDSTVEQQLIEWNKIWSEYNPKAKRKELAKKGCFKPLAPFYYTSKTGRYIASATQINKNTIIVSAGPEYKTYKYIYTKKEQAQHTKDCNNELQLAIENYNKLKNLFLQPFNIFSYSEGKQCFVAGKIVEYKDISKLKCIATSNGTSVWKRTN
jgi:hypothetical protein